MSEQNNNPRSIAEVLQDFVMQLEASAQDNVSVAAVLDALHERGFGVVLLFFALPMALPVPVPPVLNVLLALPLLLLCAQQMCGAHSIWMPDFVLRRTFKVTDLSPVLTKITPFLRKIESLTKPRLIWCTGALGQKITGAMGVVMAVSVMVPLPLTNTVPSFGIAVMALGVLMRDGVAVLAGAVVGLAWVLALFGFLFVFGLEGLEIFKDAIKSLM